MQALGETREVGQDPSGRWHLLGLTQLTQYLTKGKQMEALKFQSERRNGYGAVDLYRDGVCLRTIMAGIKPAKDADAIAGALNEAYWNGHADAFQNVEIAVLSSIVARPSRFTYTRIKEVLIPLLENARRG